MLVDEIIIQIEAGNGGDGKASFRREKFVPKGGPDGGDGGNGGGVIIRGVEDITSLNKFRFKKEFKAENGEQGENKKKSGANGKDLVLTVPAGTVIKDIGTEEAWEIVRVGEEILIAEGGKGGRGNWHFRSATNQTPTEFEYGTYGRKRELLLELRLIADIGFIGFPSVGKSSLLNELISVGAKVAPYHFTTLEPNLGVMDGIILADLPGLIEGASEGKGLGIKFLRHIRRTKALVHCIGADSKNPLKDYEDIRKELSDYDKELLLKPELILITKSDLVSPQDLEKIKDKLKKTKRDILPVSIYDYDQIQAVKERLEKLA
ncbi:Obg family GTPase CgtA [Patescibacteria group bacterium]|nr:Obg family GTPase CgtA [Patescibacteria group bacterium]